MHACCAVCRDGAYLCTGGGVIVFISEASMRVSECTRICVVGAYNCSESFTFVPKIQCQSVSRADRHSVHHI